ncbi:unnamed protein product, partial [Iphiclides podalirius]
MPPSPSCPSPPVIVHGFGVKDRRTAVDRFSTLHRFRSKAQIITPPPPSPSLHLQSSTDSSRESSTDGTPCDRFSTLHLVSKDQIILFSIHQRQSTDSSRG